MRQSQFRKTHTTLKRLIRLSVETGLITASGATVELILWQAEKYLNYHYALYVYASSLAYVDFLPKLYSPLSPSVSFLIFGKLYSNAMMAALNSRDRTWIRSHSTNTSMDTVTVHNELTLFQDEYWGTSSHGAALQPTSINIIRSVEVEREGHEMCVMSASPILLL